MNNIFRIDLISELHEVVGYDKPKHPLITILNLNKISGVNVPKNAQTVSGLYTIALKLNCPFKYGRQNYDFREGSLMSAAPEQVVIIDDEDYKLKQEGWMLCFHPDLIRKSELGRKMNEFTFFSYEVSEALHLSEKEKEIITNIVKTIENELNQNIDEYSQDLIVSNIEVLLNYSKRFYGRQFITRSIANNDVIRRFNILIGDYFNSKDLEEKGIPNVKYLANKMGYSTNYLSDLLRKETGKNTQEHIQLHLIEKAKTLLLGSSEPVNRIAYMLGFEYPAHFSKFFKLKTGISPMEFRK
ncbi:transcriptional regulator, AraC family [Clostridium sp. DL-VIII]|uniref:helix-turn-helix domain-containing protein n=1 Tax=Clostridium sp. DL-VIII TaxID=641107 RepID=UPI00023B0025|nr:helix-turn-helix domain-containing protein [Clostridium sp. DL-VIII]EHI99141.1 transcriptional regulator, AraC family [Clostridium sp. DL-VIII]